ncbi:primase-helicase family protein [Uliginosibacterium gangwonense]|uniref:primase-helicase family protein n=1 Tax=Uliginosibacterium gangwonense TaxID=392736 RepID=UPI0003A0E32C|nr:primase-helicase family protein [Uliginosibacterium gangwonense]
MPAIKLTFLSGNTPLTKRIVKNLDGSITKHGYPHVANFTSRTVPVSTLRDFHVALSESLKKSNKPCLLKGTIQKDLSNESRAKSTSSNTSTAWVCFDLDRAPFSSPEEFMAAIGLKDVSYIVQYSASYKLNAKDRTLSAHIFCLLSSAMQPGQLKAWLMHLNFTVKVLRNALSLTNSAGSNIHYPLDITACQNDKLLYIAEPTFVGMTSPIKATERVKLAAKDLPHIPVERIALKPLDALNRERRSIWNKLRENAGLPACTVKIKQQGEYTVQNGLGQISGYEIIDDGGEYIRYNLAHADGSMGDSAAYWHPRTNFELLHSFKGEDSMLMKEVMPERYAELTRELKGELQSVSEDGDVMLAFRNSEDSEYYSCLWNEAEHTLWLKRVKSKDALNDWVLSHGRQPGPFIPTWRIHFDPTTNTVVNLDEKTINTFVLPPLLRNHDETKSKTWKHIKILVTHVLGNNEDCVEHFLNHLAVVFQTRQKPGTAWVLHGIYGTGKGMLVNNVLRGILGQYVAIKPVGQLEDRFNDWIATALIGFVDEIEVDALVSKSIDGDLRNMITEPTFSVRRMHSSSVEVPNYTMLIFSANKPQPVRIPQGDRRYNVGDYQAVKLEVMLLSEHKLTTAQFLKHIENELAAFTHYLMTRKADRQLARTIIETENRKRIQELSITSVEETARAVLTGDMERLFGFMPDEALLEETGMVNFIASSYATLIKRWGKESVSYISRDELQVVFQHCVGNIPESANKFTSYLRHHDIVIKAIRQGNRVLRGIVVEWQLTPELKAELFPPKPPLKKLRSIK